MTYFTCIDHTWMPYAKISDALLFHPWSIFLLLIPVLILRSSRSDLSEIWINAIYAPNSERFTNRHLIWTFHCNCLYLSHFYEELPNNLAPLNIKSIPINLKFELMQHMQQITERLTTRVRIWTFHCNCLYISHFNEELSNIIVAELQIISDRSEI